MIYLEDIVNMETVQGTRLYRGMTRDQLISLRKDSLPTGMDGEALNRKKTFTRGVEIRQLISITINYMKIYCWIATTQVGTSRGSSAGRAAEKKSCK